MGSVPGTVAKPIKAASLIALVLVVAMAVGCGSGPTFTAEELIAAVNERGAGLALGEPLPSAEDEVKVHAVEFPEDPHADDAGDPHADDGHGGGSLLIAEDDDAAVADYQRCEQAASLICFRAANAVLIFEDTVPRADIERVDGAIRALGSG